MGHCGAGLGRRPERLEQLKDAALAGGEPERTGQAEVDRGGLQRQRRGALPDQGGDFLSAAEIGLMNDAGLAVDAGAFDDVVVELIAFFLRDKGRHTCLLYTSDAADEEDSVD